MDGTDSNENNKFQEETVDQQPESTQEPASPKPASDFIDPVTLSEESLIDKIVEESNVKNEKEETGVRETRESAIEKHFLSFAGRSMRELNELAKNYSKVSGGDPDKVSAWVKAYTTAIQNLMSSETAYEGTTGREEADWGQKVSIDEQNIGIASLRFNETSKEDVISGRDAILAIGKEADVGTPITIPLWHTGIWITISPPEESDFLRLESLLSREKIWLGRQTSGLAFSNTMVYTVEKIVNLLMKKVIDCSLENYSIAKLKNIIKVTDLYPLVWGLAVAKYPRSYKYVRPCVAGPTSCTYLAEGEISLAKLFWTDRSALSNKQKRHMARREEKFTQKDIQSYQDEHMRGGDLEIQMSDDISILLSVPTIAQYIQSGRSWVEDIVEMTEGSLTSSSEDEKNEHIYQQGLLSALRKYGHWVKEIRTSVGRVTDQETIDQLLNRFSSDDEFMEIFEKAISDFIDDCTISLIGIPTYNCPSCGKPQKEPGENDHFPHLIPLDVINVFFTLQDQRIYKGLTNRTL